MFSSILHNSKSVGILFAYTHMMANSNQIEKKKIYIIYSCINVIDLIIIEMKKKVS